MNDGRSENKIVGSELMLFCWHHFHLDMLVDLDNTLIGALVNSMMYIDKGVFFCPNENDSLNQDA